jgi:hypothetical protein
MPLRGLRTSRIGGTCAAGTALLDLMVGEARAYVQGESLKARAALLTEASQLPDHQDREFGYACGIVLRLFASIHRDGILRSDFPWPVWMRSGETMSPTTLGKGRSRQRLHLLRRHSDDHTIKFDRWRASHSNLSG